MSVSENKNHINGWNTTLVRPGIQFSNSVNVRTFGSVTNNYGVNTGNTEIESEQKMTHKDVEAAYKSSRNTLKAGQNASKQQRIRKRERKRLQYKQQIASNIRIIRQRLEQYQATPPDAQTLSQFQGVMDQELHRMVNTLQQENRLQLGIFNEEISALNQLYSDIQRLQPAPSPNILVAGTDVAGKIHQGMNEVEQLLGDMTQLMSQKPTMQILAELDTMITQADQTIRVLLKTSKTQEERETIVALIGKLRELKEQHNQYILTGIGKKGGRRKTHRHRRRSHRKSKRS